jgi:hypothetical protein
MAAAVAVLALSGVAHAEGVRVTVTGKSAATLRADIEHAARTVCTASLDADVRGAYEDLGACVDSAVGAAYAQIREHPASFAMVDQASKTH